MIVFSLIYQVIVSIFQLNQSQTDFFDGVRGLNPRYDIYYALSLITELNSRGLKQIDVTIRLPLTRISLYSCQVAFQSCISTNSFHLQFHQTKQEDVLYILNMFI